MVWSIYGSLRSDYVKWFQEQMPYGQDLSARAVAKRFELSVSSLQHFFRRFANQSFHKYVEEVRMGKAFELISEGNKRIKEVVYAMAITTGAFELKIHDICLFTVP